MLARRAWTTHALDRAQASIELLSGTHRCRPRRLPSRSTRPDPTRPDPTRPDRRDTTRQDEDVATQAGFVTTYDEPAMCAIQFPFTELNKHQISNLGSVRLSLLLLKRLKYSFILSTYYDLPFNVTWALGRL